MSLFLKSAFLITGLLGQQPAQLIDSSYTNVNSIEMVDSMESTNCGSCMDDCMSCRRPFASDNCFDGFIGPVTNSFLAKDPRSLTEMRLIAAYNWSNNNTAFGDGMTQLYGVAFRIALSDRLQLNFDKSGYGVVTNTPGGVNDRDGFLNLATGLKYALVRDVENQFLWNVGFQYEAATGDPEIFQGTGAGLITLYTTMGKEWGCDGRNHSIINVGFQQPWDNPDNSSFSYVSLHGDRRITENTYLFMETNWYHYFDGGFNGIPETVGEFDGIINLGTSDVAGNDLIHWALGMKVKIGCNSEWGIAYEIPGLLSNREDILHRRVTTDFIIRF